MISESRRLFHHTLMSAIISTVIILQAFGTTTGSERSSGLSKDFAEFLSLISVEKIITTVRRHQQTDPEVKELMRFLRTPEVVEYTNWLYEHPALQRVLRYLEQHDIPAFRIASTVFSLFGRTPITTKPAAPRRPSPPSPSSPSSPPSPSSSPPELRRRAPPRAKRSVKGLVDELRDLVSPIQLAAFYTRKVKTSPEFREFIAMLRSDEFFDMLDEAQKKEGYKKLIEKLKELGVDIDSFYRAFRLIFRREQRRQPDQLEQQQQRRQREQRRYKKKTLRYLVSRILSRWF